MRRSEQRVIRLVFCSRRFTCQVPRAKAVSGIAAGGVLVGVGRWKETGWGNRGQ